jgi:hypothetical protein
MVCTGIYPKPAGPQVPGGAGTAQKEPEGGQDDPCFINTPPRQNSPRISFSRASYPKPRPAKPPIQPSGGTAVFTPYQDCPAVPFFIFRESTKRPAHDFRAVHMVLPGGLFQRRKSWNSPPALSGKTGLWRVFPRTWNIKPNLRGSRVWEQTHRGLSQKREPRGGGCFSWRKNAVPGGFALTQR